MAITKRPVLDRAAESTDAAISALNDMRAGLEKHVATLSRRIDQLDGMLEAETEQHQGDKAAWDKAEAALTARCTRVETELKAVRDKYEGTFAKVKGILDKPHEASV